MKRISRVISALLVCTMVFSMVACSKKDKDSDGAVYYLNFKPEQKEEWEALAKAYTDETGVDVTVVTAADGTYEATLTSEMAKSDAPTLFQVTGPVGLERWKDYCYDLAKSDVYGELTNTDFALKGANNEVFGIAYVVETYGIITNTKILNDYCKKDYAVIKSIDDIKSFDTLKKVADSIQKNKADLGVDGAFTSAGMDSSSDWRFKTHLANLPIYYEYKADGITKTDAIKGTYLDKYKQIWDLYITDSTCEPSMISAKTGDDATAEFCTGKAVFYQNGTWAWCDDMDKEIGADNITMLPIYIGGDGEEKQGLCTGSENYWCVNKNSSTEDIEATLDFLDWVVTSDKGTKALAEEMKFVCPFKNAKESSNPFVKIADKYVADGFTPVSWNFTTMPSENWKNDLGSALTAYAAGTGSWDDVKSAFVDGWAKEVNASK